MTNIDAKVFLTTRWLGFGIASVISALLNIYLLRGLDSSFGWALIMTSLGLEMTKLSSLLSGNIFTELYYLLNIESLKNKARKYYAYYIFFAIFSIFCSLGFSLSVTQKVDSNNEFIRNNLQSGLDLIKDKTYEIEATKLLSKTDIFTHPDYITASTALAQAQANYDDILIQEAAARRERDALPKTILNEEGQQVSNPDWEAANRKYASLRPNDYKGLVDRAQGALTQQTNRLNELKADSSSELEKLNLELEALAIEYEVSTLNPIGELEAKIRANDARELNEAGTGKVFIILAQTLKINPVLFKFIILLLLSLLIELTIYQLGPEITIVPVILKHFKKALPREVNVALLISRLKEEYEKYSADWTSEQKNTSKEPESKIKRHRRTTVGKKIYELDNAKPVRIPKERKTNKRNKTAAEADRIEENTKEIKEKETKPEAILPDTSFGNGEISFQELSQSLEVLPDELETNADVHESSDSVNKSEPDKRDIGTSEPEIPKPELGMARSETEPVDEFVGIHENSENLVAKVPEGKLKPPSKKTYNYMFGPTTERVKDELVAFVSKCIDKAGYFTVHPLVAAKELNMTDRARDVFLDRLQRISYGGKPLIIKNKYNEYLANWDRQTIIDTAIALKS
jgi:hypothetical protein